MGMPDVCRAIAIARKYYSRLAMRLRRPSTACSCLCLAHLRPSLNDKRLCCGGIIISAIIVPFIRAYYSGKISP